LAVRRRPSRAHDLTISLTVSGQIERNIPATQNATHPIRGASWETIVLEDLIRPEKLENPHTQFFFWRTAAGLEADLLFDRGSERVIFEIKTGEGEVLRTLRRIEATMFDTGAGRAHLITQADGILPLAPALERRGFSSCLDWLP
jgi:predicted AAA+ superfamily ATPase